MFSAMQSKLLNPIVMGMGVPNLCTHQEIMIVRDDLHTQKKVGHEAKLRIFLS